MESSSKSPSETATPVAAEAESPPSSPSRSASESGAGAAAGSPYSSNPGSGSASPSKSSFHERFQSLSSALRSSGLSIPEILTRFGLSVSSGVDPSTISIDDIAQAMTMRFSQPRRKLPHVNTLEDLVSLLQSVSKVVVISGAGISTSCGIPDFRSANGLYSIVSQLGLSLSDPQLVFNIHFFRRDPRPFYLVSQRLFQSEGSQTFSPTHAFIAQLEAHGKLLRDYTQNIDNLEQKASITKLIQCHGSYSDAFCLRCNFHQTMDEIMPSILRGEVAYCPRCPEFTDPLTLPVMKPSIVMFGEQLPDVFHDHFQSDLKEAELVIAVGSSMKVAPVNHFIELACEQTPMVLINREIVGRPHEFDMELLGDCDAVCEELMAMLGWGEERGELKPESAPKNVQLGARTLLLAHFRSPYAFVSPSRYLFQNGSEAPQPDSDSDSSSMGSGPEEGRSEEEGLEEEQEEEGEEGVAECPPAPEVSPAP